MQQSESLASRAESMLATVRRMPITEQLVPAEAGIGWPIPMRRAGQVYAVLPFFGMAPHAGGGAILYRPFATMTLRWTDLAPVEYVSLRFLDPKPEEEWNTPIGRFPHAALEGVTTEQYLGYRRNLLHLYDHLMNAFTSGAQLASEDERKFKRLLRLLLDPAMEPFYRMLGPSGLGAKFCDRFLHASTD